jgi:ubiquinone/menaquinone biosynthesis C-methylase UbiE
VEGVLVKKGRVGGEPRPRQPVALYDRIGRGYDRTRRADPGIAGTLGQLLGPGAGGRYLDVACGTGNYTVALAEAGGRFFGVDPSCRMLAVARDKRSRAIWVCAAAEALPFPDSSVDGALCVMGIHHLHDRRAACAEVARVLTRGRFVLFTSTREQMEGFWLHAYFPRAMRRSMERMPGLAELVGALSSAGFARIRTEPYDVPADVEDLFLYAGKRRPTLYLDGAVRSGMSTFAACSDPREVELGCARLAADCESGRIEDVVAKYRSKGGDYIFVVAERGDQT